MAKKKHSEQDAVDEQQSPKHEASGLVAMIMGEEEIEVHPTTVQEHEQHGWKVKGGE